MKARLLLLTIICLLFGTNADGQILKKLKKKVENTTEKVLLKKTEEKTEKTVEGTIDGAINSENKGNAQQSQNIPATKDPDANKAKLINTEAKRSFYTKDLIVTTSENGEAGSSFYFDADNLAMRGTSPKTSEDMFIDSEGFQYAYNDSNKRWEKTGLMRSDAMSFMMPAMSMSLLQLPPGPMLDATENAKAKGMNLNTFMIVEWAFIYKPDHFRNDDYTESKINGGTRFDYTDPEYAGSYVNFDDENRLSQALIKLDTPEGMKTGIYNFDYTPVEVNIPSAVEVKMPFQDLYMSGLDMTNEGDSQVNNKENENSDSEISHKQIKSMQENMENSDLGTEDLPASYDFDWRYHLKMNFVNQKKEAMDLVFLLKNNANYQGVTIENAASGSINEATMVFDLKINALVMFVNTEQNKILQIHPMQTPKASGEMEKFEIRELPAKTIIGFNCKGLELENDKSIVQVYHTDEAPIEMKNLFNFSGPMDMDLPDLDPRLVEQFSKGLIMEMNYQDKKKSKNDVLLTAQSIQQSKTSFNKNEYQNMSFIGQFKSNKN